MAVVFVGPVGFGLEDWAVVEVGAEAVIVQGGSAAKQRQIVAAVAAEPVAGLAVGLELVGVVAFGLVVNYAFVAHSSGLVDLDYLLLVRFELLAVA